MKYDTDFDGKTAFRDISGLYIVYFSFFFFLGGGGGGGLVGVGDEDKSPRLSPVPW